jgi:3-dehydroquinate synthetase/shikimate kinase
MTDIILTGMMGTGKTVVGWALSAAYGVPFIDTDDEIERRAGCTIAEFWAANQETAFRDLEAGAFRDLLAKNAGNRIIATGAGTLVAERNRALLGNGQQVFCLTCEVDELVGRLERQDRSTRPLLSCESGEDLAATVQRRLTQRAPIYAAFEAVDTSGRDIDEIAQEIAERAGLGCAGRLTFDRRQESEVLFGRGLLGRLGPEMAARGLNGQIVVVSDRGAREAGWQDVSISSLVTAGYLVTTVAIEGGEGDKTLMTAERVCRACAGACLDRSAVIIGLGGGATCDLAGFVAATYLRGIELVLAPTTLLAQVDAAIGGKVGVDLIGFKNAVGAFYPARIVAIDPDALTSLPPALLADGLAEVVKIAFVRSRDLLDRVGALPDRKAIIRRTDIVRSAGQEKIKLVKADPYERGERALLNFGHTAGHAIETASGFALSHGQAISIGMAAETWLAEREGWCPPDTLARLTAILRRLDLPVSTAGDPGNIVPLMGQDKKRRAGRLRFAVPAEVGRGIVLEVTPEQAAAAVAHVVDGA